jgi:hypothetical protein
MSLLEKLFAAGRALRAGEVLKNPATWKVFNLVFTNFAVILAVVFQFAGIDVTDSQQNIIANGLATLGVVIFNTYFTVATTDKLGVLPKK